MPESNRPHGLLVHLTVIAPRDIPFHNRQRTFIVLFSRFLSRQRFHHKKNFICYTKIRQPCHTNAILQRIGIAEIEPANTGIKIQCLTTWQYPNVVPSANIIQSLTPIDQLFSQELSLADLSYTGCSDFSLWCSASLSRLRKSPECSGTFVLILCVLPNTLKIGGKK